MVQNSKKWSCCQALRCRFLLVSFSFLGGVRSRLDAWYLSVPRFSARLTCLNAEYLICTLALRKHRIDQRGSTICWEPSNPNPGTAVPQISNMATAHEKKKIESQVARRISRLDCIALASGRPHPAHVILAFEHTQPLRLFCGKICSYHD